MEDKKFGNKVLDITYDLIPIISELLNGEIGIVLTDKEKYLYVKESKVFQMENVAGNKISEKIKNVLVQKKQVHLDIPLSHEQRGGECYCFPLLDDEDESVGLLLIIVHNENKYKLNEIIKEFTESITQISGGIKDVTAGVQDLAVMNTDILKKTDETTNKAKDTDEIISIIQDISSQTNLLGLNASIEAARAGEFGRGFAVVAEEIRKLSNTSKESIDKIDSIIKEIRDGIHIVDEGLDKINDVSQNQSAALEEITASLDEINSTVKELNILSQNI